MVGKPSGRGCAALVALVAVGVYWWLQPAEPYSLDWISAPEIRATIPAPTALADPSRWSPKPVVSQEDIEEFDRVGYVVLRGVVDHWALDLLMEATQRACGERLKEMSWCHLKEMRWQIDEYRDFLLHGPLGHAAQAIIRKDTVRVNSDGAFTMGFKDPNNTNGDFGPVSQVLHVDDNSKAGIYGDYHRETSAVTAWVPYHDLDTEATGGGMEMVPGFLQHECRMVKSGWMHWGVTTNKTREECWHELDKLTRPLPPLRKGDVVLFHPWLMHKTQDVTVPGFHRFALFAQFVEGGARPCSDTVCNSRYPGKPCCREARVRPGSDIRHPCYPQVYPAPLRAEVDAALERRPKPMIGPAAIQHGLMLHPSGRHQCEDGPDVWRTFLELDAKGFFPATPNLTHG